MSKIRGRLYFKIGGEQYFATGDWTYNIGNPIREAVVSGAGEVFYTETMQAARIEGAVLNVQGLDINALTQIEQTDMTLEPGNGKRFLLRSGTYAGEGDVSTESAQMSVKFIGKSGEETEV